MKKLFPILLAVMVFAGCSVKNKAVDVIENNPVTSVGKNVTSRIDSFIIEPVTELMRPSSGLLLFAVVLETNTNVSSLLYDKTKEKAEDYAHIVTKKLDHGRFIYVVPPRIIHSDGTYEFNETLHTQIRNFMAAGEYGIPVDRIAQAEYIVVFNAKESFDRNYGTNSSQVNFSIMNKDDTPVYAASLRMESKSDKNFWYYAEKKAMPVRTLTMKGLAYIMANSLPEAHGDRTKLQAATDKALAKVGMNREG
ncbi:hypothetical protein [Seleniivibrio woodruffii]|uniref:hypothetical protein n=1 Tax=Seleniivibrio woodruffii TaxID=1078050 RepID=UPI0026EE0B5A|nr:hypothetical protein [Seleniivibrio woodruffii]